MEIQLKEVVKLYKEALANAQEEIFLRKVLQDQLESEIAELREELDKHNARFTNENQA